jgi:hypothetical protein
MQPLKRGYSLYYGDSELNLKANIKCTVTTIA